MTLISRAVGRSRPYSVRRERFARPQVARWWVLGMGACSCVTVTPVDSDGGTVTNRDSGSIDANVELSTRADGSVETGEQSNSSTGTSPSDVSSGYTSVLDASSSESGETSLETESAGSTETASTETASTETESAETESAESTETGSVETDSAAESSDVVVDAGQPDASSDGTSESEATSTTAAESTVVEPIRDAGAWWCNGGDGFAGCVPESEEASPLCGNGVVDTAWNEDCDDGNTADLDGCDNCKVERDWRCDEGQACVWLLADRDCTNGCWAGDTCIEVGSGVTCACPAERPAACGAVYFRSLPGLANSKSCYASATSDDGSTIVGTCFEGDDWKEVPGVWRSGELPARLAEQGTGRAVNADGSVIALSQGLSPFVLQPPNEPVTELATATYPRAMNAAGTIVVGDSFIWTQADGAIDLYSPDGAYLRGYGMDIAEVDTAYGGPVVGVGRDESGGYWAAVWTLDGVGTWLPNPEGATQSAANTVSPDGATIIGQVWFEDGYATVRWNSSGIESVEPLPPVGPSDPPAWLFDNTSDTRTLGELLTDLGVVLDNWGALFVQDRSRDGHVLVGAAQYLGSDQPNSNQRGFVIILP